jgi:hypothetical protein
VLIEPIPDLLTESRPSEHPNGETDLDAPYVQLVVPGDAI